MAACIVRDQPVSTNSESPTKASPLIVTVPKLGVYHLSVDSPWSAINPSCGCRWEMVSNLQQSNFNCQRQLLSRRWGLVGPSAQCLPCQFHQTLLWFSSLQHYQTVFSPFPRVLITDSWQRSVLLHSEGSPKAMTDYKHKDKGTEM